MPIVNKILNVKNGERCALIGTLYKDMKLKPSILDEVNAREVGEGITMMDRMITPHPTLVL